MITEIILISMLSSIVGVSGHSRDRDRPHRTWHGNNAGSSGSRHSGDRHDTPGRGNTGDKVIIASNDDGGLTQELEDALILGLIGGGATAAMLGQSKAQGAAAAAAAAAMTAWGANTLKKIRKSDKDTSDNFRRGPGGNR